MQLQFEITNVPFGFTKLRVAYTCERCCWICIKTCLKISARIIFHLLIADLSLVAIIRAKDEKVKSELILFYGRSMKREVYTNFVQECVFSFNYRSLFTWWGSASSLVKSSDWTLSAALVPLRTQSLTTVITSILSTVTEYKCTELLVLGTISLLHIEFR